MGKRVFAAFIAAVLLAGCSSAQPPSDTERSAENSEADSQKEAPDPDWEPEEILADPQIVSDVKAVTEIGETITIDYLEESGILYDVVVTRAYVTQKLEEDAGEWTEVGLNGVPLEGTQLQDGYRAVYIEFTAANLAEDVLKYPAGTIGVYMENEGQLLQASIDLGYNSRESVGKSANITEIEPKAREDFRIGYILDPSSDSCPLFLEVSGASTDTEFILVPVEG